MAEIVRMPKLSDTMTDGTVAAWHKKIGDKVNSGDVIAEIETDKATMEFESFQEGVLLYQGVEEGKSGPVDSILAILGEKGEDIDKILAEEKKGAAEKGPEKTEASKTPTKEAPKEEPKQEKPASKEPPKKETQAMAKPAPVQDNGDGRLKASPLAKKLAEERGLSLRSIRGTGDNGRITKRDIENYQGGTLGQAFVGVERYADQPVSNMRKTIARRLSESKFGAPHFYLTIDIDMDRAIDARESINKAIEPAKISFNDFVIKSAAAALRKHPKVNAAWHEDFIRYNEHVHIGVAVAVDEGLLVPVVRFADGKPLTEISAEVREYAKKAKAKKLQPQDWEGNTFTISNLGMFGIEEFTAIINPPDACILAIGSIRQEPVVKNGQIVPGNRMKVTMSCDHRVVDGATGAEFLQTFKNFMENPVVLLGAGAM